MWSAGRPPGDRFRCLAQVRAHGGVAPAVVEPGADGLTVRLDEPLRGVAPGQAVALYHPEPGGDVVLGSATIVSAQPASSTPLEPPRSTEPGRKRG